MSELGLLKLQKAAVTNTILTS